MNEEELIPARMLNELVYCQRLFYLEHVAKEWAESADTVHGTRIHQRADDGPTAMPSAEQLGVETVKARAVSLSSVVDGVVARMDILEAEGGTVTPVDYKRGRSPS